MKQIITDLKNLEIKDAVFNNFQTDVEQVVLWEDIEKIIKRYDPEEKQYVDFKNLVLAKENEGKVIIMDFEGATEMDLNDIVNQPAEGILYDLNRNREVVLTYIEDPKWVNDYAVGLVIKKLKKMALR